MKSLICVVMVIFCLPLCSQEIYDGNFNKYVLQVLKSYPTNGTHRYYWPKASLWAGNTRDLIYQDKLFAKGDIQGRCYCCGLTFEVFFRAYQKYCQYMGKPFIIGKFDKQKLLYFRRQWFGSDGNKKALYNAIIANNLGMAVPLKNAKSGDFIQFWRHSGSGHSVIFISWLLDGDQIIGLQYWSTQRSTNGIGYNTEYIGKNSGIDISRIYIARIGK